MSISIDRLEQLRAKRAALDARIEKLQQKESAQSRKARNRALILIGAALEAEVKASPSIALPTLCQVVSERLSSTRDREAALAYLNALHTEAPNA